MRCAGVHGSVPWWGAGGRRGRRIQASQIVFPLLLESSSAGEPCAASSRLGPMCPAPALTHSFLLPSRPDIVHENLKMGSDGESDQASGTSSDEVQSPTGVCLRNRGNRRISAEVGCVLFVVFAHRELAASVSICSHNEL